MRLTNKKTKQVFLPNDQDGASVTIKYLKPGIRERIDSLSNDITASGVDGDMETTVKFNLLKKRKMFLEEVIDGWSGFFDSKGKELSVTAKNIGLVDNEIDNFYTWLFEESEFYIEEIAEQLEAEEGN